jgi:hypothetical protein
VLGRESVEARRETDGRWSVHVSSNDELVRKVDCNLIIYAYVDNIGTVINSNDILQLHTLSAGNPQLQVMLKIRNLVKLYMNPWTLSEFEILSKELNLNMNKILQREFPKDKIEYYFFFQELFGKKQLSIYEVVGLNLRLLFEKYSEMKEEISCMVENLIVYDFKKKWKKSGESILSGDFLYKIKDNNHLFHVKPSNDFRSYTTIFGSPLLIQCFSSIVFLLNALGITDISPDFPADNRFSSLFVT